MKSIRSVVLVLFSVALCHADVVVSNLFDPFAGGGTIFSSGPPQIFAQEFVTPSQYYALTGVSIRPASVSGFPTFTEVAQLVADDGGLPGNTVVADFDSPVCSSCFSINFTPTANVTLSGDTNYWLVLSASKGAFGWLYTNTLNASFPNFARSHGSGFTLGTGGPFLMEVDGTATNAPEPGSLGLIMAALIAGTLVRRRSALIWPDTMAMAPATWVLF
jgi:hypothetical protein